MASLVWNPFRFQFRVIQFGIPGIEIFKPFGLNSLSEAILQLNRNARAPKAANHGARPCSSVMRRLRKRGHYKKFKEKTPIEQEEYTATWDDI